MMRQLLFFLVLFSISAQSQDFSKVDEVVATYPKFSSAEALSNQIKKDFSKDSDKARAAFYWLANNIRYNLKEYYSPTQRSYNFKYSTEEEKEQKLQNLKDKIVADAFKTKFGVCEEYAQSFKKVCDLLGLEAEVIKGNVRNVPQEIAKPENNSNHAWNTVKLNGKWIILDATWAAGYEYNGKWIRKFDNYFYNISKKNIFKTHYPSETIWVLRFGRMSVEDFYNQPIYGYGLLSSKAELISPKTGILKVNSLNEIKLKFKNLDKTSLVFYTYPGQRFAEKPMIAIKDDITTLTFKNAKKNSYLNLFIDQEVALQFKTK